MSPPRKPPPPEQTSFLDPQPASPPARGWNPKDPDYRPSLPTSWEPRPPPLPPLPVPPTGQRAQTVQDVAIDLTENDIYGRWFTFHLDNPHVYVQLRKLSLDVARNRQVFGIGAITEIARWERRFTTEGEDYKMPNAFRSMYARMLMEQEVELAGLFNTSELRTAVWPTDPASRRARAASVA